jgi:hypothetical protein
LATKYVEDEKHIPEAQPESFSGNYLYASHNAFEGKTLSRRDDLISLAHLLCFFFIGDPWWLNHVKDDESIFEQVSYFKRR